jgi:hypothetical protein
MHPITDFQLDIAEDSAPAWDLELASQWRAFLSKHHP